MGAFGPLSEQLNAVQFGPFRFEPAERRLRRDGQDVPLPPKAVDLLAALIARAGRLVTKDTLLKEVWPDTFVEEANLSYTVSVLRKALGDESPERYIDTVQKRGYRFIAEIGPAQTAVAATEQFSPVIERATASAIEVPASTAAVRASGRGSRWTRRGWYAGLAVSVLVLTGAASTLTRNWSSAVVTAPRARFDIPLPEHVQLGAFSGLTISPDGRQVTFTGIVGGKRQLLVRSLESAGPLTLPGTGGGLESILVAGQSRDRLFRRRKAEESRDRRRAGGAHSV